MREIRDIVESEEKELKLKHPPVLTDVGGSISNLPVKTPEYKAWLEEKRKHNSLIGSEFVEPAPEYSTKFELKEFEVSDATKEQIDSSKSDELYNPKTDSNIEYEDLGESPIKDTTDNKYIDFCIVELSTKKLLGRPIEDIEKDAIDEIKKHHADENYITEIDVKQVIEISEQLLIENKNNEIKKLNPPEDPLENISK